MRTFVVKGLLVAVGYALAYAALREISVTHWLLTAGLRYSAFLFLPFELWPFIVLGDITGSCYYRWNAVGVYGFPWLMMAMIGPLGSAALPAAILRLHNWDSKCGRIGSTASRMLMGGLLASLLSAGTGMIGMELIHYGPNLHRMEGTPLHFLSLFTLGDYLGILVIAPILFTQFPRRRSQELWQLAVEDGGALSYSWVAILGVTFLGMLAYTAMNSRIPEASWMARILMVVPAIIMTIRYGWYGAVPMVFLGNFALQSTLVNVGDSYVVSAQLLMAIVGTFLMIVGATFSESRLRVRELLHESRLHLGLARDNLRWGELRAMQTAATLEAAFAEIGSSSQDRLIEDRNLPAVARSQIRWNPGLSLQHDIEKHVEALRMTAVQNLGMQLALHSGPLKQMLESAGVQLVVKVRGDARTMPHDMSVISYRVVHEFVMRLVRDHCARKVRVRIVVKNDARGTIAIVAKVQPGPKPAPKLPPPYSTSHEIKNIAQTYRGDFHDHSKRQQPTLALLIRDR